MLLQLFGGFVDIGKPKIFEYKVLEDLELKKIFNTPYSTISVTNLTQNKIILNHKSNFKPIRSLNWIINRNPNNRFMSINQKVKKGDILRLKIEALATASTTVPQLPLINIQILCLI